MIFNDFCRVEAKPIKIAVVKNYNVSKWNDYGSLFLWATSLTCENFWKLGFNNWILCEVKVLCYQYYISTIRRNLDLAKFKLRTRAATKTALNSYLIIY